MLKNKVRVNIAGSYYVILSDEEESYTKLIAEEVNKKIEEIKKSSSDISSLMAAILTAMDFCDLYSKSILTLSNSNIKDEQRVKEKENLQKENSELKKKINEMEKKIKFLENKVLENKV